MTENKPIGGRRSLMPIPYYSVNRALAGELPIDGLKAAQTLSKVIENPPYTPTLKGEGLPTSASCSTGGQR